MTTINVKCPYCGSENVIRYGISKSGNQKYKCRNETCPHGIFQLEYKNKASEPGMAEKIVNMAMNGSGTRDTARVLGISKDTVTRHLRKLADRVQTINVNYLENMREGKEIEILITNPFEDQSEVNEEDCPTEGKAFESNLGVEMDEQWSFCGKKSHQVWLWWAVDHESNVPLAFCFGTREYCNLDVLLKKLEPFHVKAYYTDNNFAYSSRIPKEKLHIGKRNTQRIERNHLTLRTRIKRLARKTICFSKKQDIHEAVIGTFINTYFFGIQNIA